MKSLSFYSHKKRNKFYWLIAIIILSFVYACGPTKEELERRAKDQQIEATPNIIMHSSDCECGDVSLKIYESNGHQYIGQLYNYNSDVLTHSGDCKNCQRKDSLLMLSILKNFFQVSKK